MDLYHHFELPFTKRIMFREKFIIVDIKCEGGTSALEVLEEWWSSKDLGCNC
jgi:hypothetical protein